MMYRRNASLVLTLAALLVASCASPLNPVNRGDGGTGDVSPDAALVNGIEVIPAVITPGTRVTLRDPAPVDPDRAAPLYYWDACDGALDESVASYGPTATWVAPDAPGLYAITVNITNTPRDNPSRVIPLCVDLPDAGSCASASEGSVATVTATPDSLRQIADCGGSCTTQLAAATTGGNFSRYRWAARRGEVVGAGATAEWRLPTVGCCTESFTAAVTACGTGGAAATGFTHVVLFPE